MKKIFAILIAMVGCLTAFAADPEPIQDMAASVNATCPVDLGGGITLQSVTVNLQPISITYTYAVDGQKVNFKGLKSRAPMLKNSKIAELTTDSGNQPLRDAAITNNASIVYIYTCGPDSFSITLTPADLK